MRLILLKPSMKETSDITWRPPAWTALTHGDMDSIMDWTCLSSTSHRCLMGWDLLNLEAKSNHSQTIPDPFFLCGPGAVYSRWESFHHLHHLVGLTSKVASTWMRAPKVSRQQIATLFVVHSGAVHSQDKWHTCKNGIQQTRSPLSIAPWSSSDAHMPAWGGGGEQGFSLCNQLWCTV